MRRLDGLLLWESPWWALQQDWCCTQKRLAPCWQPWKMCNKIKSLEEVPSSLDHPQELNGTRFDPDLKKTSSSKSKVLMKMLHCYINNWVGTLCNAFTNDHQAMNHTCSFRMRRRSECKETSTLICMDMNNVIAKIRYTQRNLRFLFPLSMFLIYILSRSPQWRIDQ